MLSDNIIIGWLALIYPTPKFNLPAKRKWSDAYFIMEWGF